MNRSLIIAIATLGVITWASPSQATVLGSADMSLHIVGSGPITARYNYGDRQYGRIFDTTLSPTSITTFLDPTTLTDASTYGSSTLEGSFDTTTGATSFSFEANATDPVGGSLAAASVDLFASTFFTGTLEDFSYAYNFSGTKDTDTDLLQLIVQMEISFYDESSGTWLKVYSDYGTSDFAPGLDPATLFRTNWVTERDETNSEASFVGTREFGDYSQYGSRDWWFRYDFQGGGRDSFGSSSAVPAPPTLVLIGFGLCWIVGYRKKPTR